MANFLDALKFMLWAEIVERYALLVLILYLTDVWGLGLTYAAGLINIWVGITKAMPLAFLFFIENYTGSYWMCLISSIASAIGMGLLSMSTPSLFYGRVTGSCNEYVPHCVTQTQKYMLFIALTFIMIGQSARDATIFTLRFRGNEDEQKAKKRKLASGTKIVTLISGVLLPMINSWSIRFGIPAICSLLVARVLVTKSWSYKLYIDVPKRSPSAKTVFSFLMVSSSKMFEDLPKEIANLSQESETRMELLPSSTLRRMEEGEPIKPFSNNRRRKWTHFLEVDDTRGLIVALLVCVMFVFLGLISSIGNTYFLEQAKRLKPMSFLGEEFGVSSLLAIHDGVKGNRLKLDIKNYKMSLNQSHGMMLSSFYATICCLIAALVERKRLNVIRRHDLGLESKLDGVIPMTILWLFPQFYALGMYDGMFQQTIGKFFMEKVPSSMKSLGMLLCRGLIGFGMVSSVLFVYVLGKISEIGGKASWFQHDTESSRLDYCYWVLTALCIVICRLWLQLDRFMIGRNWREMDQLTPFAVGIVFISFFFIHL